MRATRDWENDALADAEELGPERVSHGCKFADRCPAVMAQCWESPPPLYRTDEHRAARCFLYEDASVLQREDVSATFAPPKIVEAASA
jgi:ABC-type dipeptide/oligopeptide/nickel transport system ATPase component